MRRHDKLRAAGRTMTALSDPIARWIDKFMFAFGVVVLAPFAIALAVEDLIAAAFHRVLKTRGAAR